jgi:hypothetical protein
MADDELKIVTTTSTAGEADIVVGRLREDGIRAIPRSATGYGSRRGWNGSCDVLVSERDLERARELLKADEGAFSDEELTRLSEQAAREAEQT